MARAIDAPAAEREALRNLGFAYLMAGDAAQSIATYQQALALARQLGQQETFNTLNALGNAYATFGETASGTGSPPASPANWLVP